MNGGTSVWVSGHVWNECMGVRRCVNGGMSVWVSEHV